MVFSIQGTGFCVFIKLSAMYGIHSKSYVENLYGGAGIAAKSPTLLETDTAKLFELATSHQYLP